MCEAAIRDTLECRQEPNNSMNQYAVAIILRCRTVQWLVIADKAGTYLFLKSEPLRIGELLRFGRKEVHCGHDSKSS